MNQTFIHSIHSPSYKDFFCKFNSNHNFLQCKNSRAFKTEEWFQFQFTENNQKKKILVSQNI